VFLPGCRTIAFIKGADFPFPARAHSVDPHPSPLRENVQWKADFILVIFLAIGPTRKNRTLEKRTRLIRWARAILNGERISVTKANTEREMNAGRYFFVTISGRRPGIRAPNSSQVFAVRYYL
jgi:hypothetical protein